MRALGSKVGGKLGRARFNPARLDWEGKGTKLLEGLFGGDKYLPETTIGARGLSQLSGVEGRALCVCVCM